MWIAKFRVKALDSIFGEAAQRYNLVISAYPVMHREEKNRVFLQGAGKAYGAAEDINRFVANLKKDKSVKRVYHKNDFFIFELVLDKQFKPLYSPEIIWVKPAVLSGGFEDYVLASWDKRFLVKVMDCLKKYDLKIRSFKRGKIESISLTAGAPNLTDKQRKAFNLAVKHGYYKFPKEVELKELAKFMGVNYSTYQAHLKKAESKILPTIDF